MGIKSKFEKFTVILALALTHALLAPNDSMGAEDESELTRIKDSWESYISAIRQTGGMKVEFRLGQSKTRTSEMIFRFADSCFQREAIEDQGEYPLKVFSVNPNYQFNLQATSLQHADLVVEAIDDRENRFEENQFDKKLLPSFGCYSGLLVVPGSWMDFAFFSHDGVDLLIVEEQTDRIKIRFEADVEELLETFKGHPLPSSGEMWLSTKANYLPVRLVATYPNGRNLDCEWEIDDNKLTSITTNPSNNNIWHPMHIEVQEFFNSPFPPEQFRIAAFGFPELKRFAEQPQKSFPYWVMGLSVGLISIAAFFFLRVKK